MKPSIRPNKPKFAKKYQSTVLSPKLARMINDLTAILIFAFASIIALALATYSVNDNSWHRVLDTTVVYNKVGVVGAYVADILFYVSGHSIWWLVVGLFYLGYQKIIRNKIAVGNWYTIFQAMSFLLLILASSVFEFLVFYGHESSLPAGTGGIIGSFVGLSFVRDVGEVSLLLGSLLIVFLSCTFTFSISWMVIAEKIGAVLEYCYLKLTKLVERKSLVNTSEFLSKPPVSAATKEPENLSVTEEPSFSFNGNTTHETEFNTDNEIYNESNNFTLDEPLIEPVEKPNFLNKIFNKPLETEQNDFTEISSDNDSFFLGDLDTINSNAIDDDLIELPDFNSNKEFTEDVFNEEVKEVKEFSKPQFTLKPSAIISGATTSIIRPFSANTGNPQLPSTSLLTMPKTQLESVTPEMILHVSQRIESSLADFGVDIKICNVESGPVITRYELVPPRGVKGDKIASYAKEIARSLALPSIRIVENIIGKNTMGIEVPNFKRQTIYLKEIFDSRIYQDNNSLLTLALGKDIAGEVIVTDLAKMPHLLVAGTTGSGKSVSVNAMILSILFNATAEQVKFIMIDPKMVELSFYQDIPHLLAPVVTDMSQAANALKWTVGEMERRYKLMAKIGTKKLTDFNAKIEAAEKSGKPLFNPFSADLSNPEPLEKWPFIVVIIDELADLMMVAGKKIEQYIARIAQKARAVGIHLIVATQRPSVDVITGLIKANIPARIGFQVASRTDSATIIGQNGAEALLGQGDMLFLNPGSGFPRRIHGAYVNDDELHQVVEFLKTQGKPDYNDEILDGEIDVVIPGVEDDNGDSNSVEKDVIFDQAVRFILESKRCSISSLQTQFGIGYNKAARIMNHLEKIGMVRRTERGGFELLNHTPNI